MTFQTCPAILYFLEMCSRVCIKAMHVHNKALRQQTPVKERKNDILIQDAKICEVTDAL